MTNPEIQKAVNAVRDLLGTLTGKMSPADYKQVCEEISADMDGNIDALKDENPELE